MGDIVAPCCRESQELKQLKRYIFHSLSENEYLKTKLKKTNPTPKIQKEPSNSSSRLLEYESEIYKLKRELSTAVKQNDVIKNQHSHQQQDHQLELKKRELQQTVEQLSQRLQDMKEKNAAQERQLQKMIDRMQDEVQRSHNDKDQIEAEMKAMKEKMKIKQEELLRDAKTSQQQKQALALELRQHTARFEKQIQAKDQRIQELNSNIQKMEYDKTVSKISQQDLKKQEELQEQLNKINSELQKLRYSRAQAYNKLSSIKYASFFNNSLLLEENDLKQYLATTIEAHFSKKIAKTKFLCQYDEYNKVNIHRYIDYKYGLALVIKLTNGMFIGGFSEGPFYPKMVSKYDGLIISLTNRKTFSPLVKNQKAIVYDEYFVIFGNSQLRLKTGQKKVFSNFGVNNSYYDCKGEKVNILFGENTVREVSFIGYEFYEVIFEP